LIGKDYKNDQQYPCVFIKKTSFGFAITTVYVDNINIIGTLNEIRETASYLKSEFEIKDLGKIRFVSNLWNTYPPVCICPEDTQAI
jgi:hypothetical protein